ncbi:hypothetical protein HMN09_00497700 [Mycena chlorophos]|uniref:Uncharacterized protein n=1 Tax=Mycena chlorophos TaxID=658473 RepID=A0A8H6T978_MYCCL|nr:hypothetical protein HMN09_00497700 [Mycena chlorophos]
MTTKEQAPASTLRRIIVGAYTIGGVVFLSAFPSAFFSSTELRPWAIFVFSYTLLFYALAAVVPWTDAKRPLNMRLLQALCFLMIILLNSDLSFSREPLRALGVPDYLIIASPAACAVLGFRLIFKWWGEIYWDPAALQDE